VSQTALHHMAERLGISPKRNGLRRPFLFYSIIDSVNPRKNLLALLTAFATAFPAPDEDVRLVLKQYRKPQDLSGIPHVISIDDPLDNEEIGALHALCDAYVSAHHAEAWGLPLSEAMSFGNPVIATGYSGNMEFMNEANSFPVPWHPSPVSEAMCRTLPQLFTPAMTWADIDIPALVRTLRRVRRQPWTAADRARVVDSMARFSPNAMAARLENLLDALRTGVQP
ncbi:MAG: glycosyltransferase, partial [Desulfovibrio sp.]|nr:glycosyltransferase [Desulfovibrio sp.]